MAGRKRITDEQKAQVRALWGDDYTLEEIAQEVGIGTASVYRIRQELGLRPRQGRTRAARNAVRYRRLGLPTREIAHRLGITQRRAQYLCREVSREMREKKAQEKAEARQRHALKAGAAGAGWASLIF